MVDSVKNYGITGVGSTIELGKQGSKIDASNASVISFKDKDSELIAIAIAEGVDPEHAVALSQLDAADAAKLSYITTTVNYDSGTVTVGNVSANTYVHSVSVEKGVGNWTDVGANTEITVGDAGDSDRLFSGFDTTAQVTIDDGHLYTSADTISIIVTQGGASAGTAKVTIWYSGTISDAAIPGGGGGGGTAGIDGTIGFDEMSPPVVAGQQLEDFTATVNDPIGFTINNDAMTGVAITGMTASNKAFFATYGTGTKTCTWGPGSTVASSTITVSQNNTTVPPGVPQLVFMIEGQTGAATYNYPFTFS